MISSLKALSGFAKELLPKKLNFKTGLNILFGPNGSGKTTALKLMAAYSSCGKGGWTSVPVPSFSNVFSKGQKIDWQMAFYENAPGKCKCKVSWDGTPTYMWIPDHDRAAMATFEITDGIVSSQEAFSEFVNHSSSGERILLRLKKLGDALKAMPSFAQVPEYVDTMEGMRALKGCNSLYQDNAKQFTDYVNSLQHSNIPTLLMDEPDKSLSLPDAALLWKQVLPHLAEKHQVIVATHCPFAFVNKNAHWVTVGKKKDYLEECRKSISSLSLT